MASSVHSCSEVKKYDELELILWPRIRTGLVNSCKIVIDVVHTYHCGQTAECEEKLVLQCETKCLLTKIHGFMSHITDICTLLYMYC